jgi:hypothetical protein
VEEAAALGPSLVGLSLEPPSVFDRPADGVGRHGNRDQDVDGEQRAPEWPRLFWNGHADRAQQDADATQPEGLPPTRRRRGRWWDC